MSMLPKKTGSIDWSELRLPGSITPGVEPSETPIQAIFDFHAHSFGTTLADMVDYAVGSASTMGTQMDRVVSLQTGVPRVKQSVLAVMKNPRAGEGYSSDSFVLNFATALAAYKNPDAFIGFAQVLPEEMRNPGLDVADEAELWLSGMAFGGIGELFVHGHHENYNADVTLPGDNLSELCEIARTYNVPILVHWEFGRTDEEEDPAEERTPEENYEQLLALLNRFMAPDPPPDPWETDHELKFRLKLVVAHCGLGPADPDESADSGGMDDGTRTAWLERMDALLSGYQNVLFDLAGLQVGDATVDPTVAVQRLTYLDTTTSKLTTVGSALLERIQKYPTRFLLGTDANGEYESTTGSALGIDSYKASIQQYLDFLDMGSLSYDDKRAVCKDNATQVLYGVYP
jgi:predicted TIM-barrel fold metal-dependent hydrolase